MHRKFFSAVFLAFTLTVFPNVSFALRCGTNLLSTGDFKFEALQHCGEPVSKEVIGYIDQSNSSGRIRVMNIEEWVIKVSGYYYSLIFEGNKLVEIESIGRKNR